MKASHKGMLQMLLTATLWSIGGIFIKQIPWNAFALAGMRSLIAGLVLFIYIRIAGIRLEISKKTLLMALCLAGTQTSFVVANKLTTAANAIALQYCAPVFILIYGALFQKKKLRAADVLVVALTALGIALFFVDQLGGGTTIGNLVGILSGVFFAGMFLTSGGIDAHSRINGILQAQMITFLIGIPFCLTTSMPFTFGSVTSILALGVFQLGLSYVVYSFATRTCPPLMCSLLAVMEPLLNPVWVFLFAGEAPGRWSLIGGIVVVGAITAWCVFNELRPQKQAEPLSNETAGA